MKTVNDHLYQEKNVLELRHVFGLRPRLAGYPWSLAVPDGTVTHDSCDPWLLSPMTPVTHDSCDSLGLLKPKSIHVGFGQT